MIVSILEGYLASFKSALSDINFYLKYPDTPMPYPLKGTAVTLGVKGAKIGHNSLCTAKKFNIDLKLCVDIHGKSAQDCYTTFDRLYLSLMDNENVHPFSALEVQDITYDGSTAVFTLPVFADLKLNTEEETE